MSNYNFSKQEIIEDILEYLENTGDVYGCDLHSEVFNTDYYIIGTFKAVEEQEKPKKYKLKHKLAEDAYLNYFKDCIENENKLIFANRHETGSFKTIFTIQEWESLTEQTWEDLLLQFKAIEV